MSKLYGVEQIRKRGKHLCEKCHSHFDTASKKCPWCGTPVVAEEKSNAPTDSDKFLFKFLSKADEITKKKIIRFIEDNF